jgi:hypothetical protein
MILMTAYDIQVDFLTVDVSVLRFNKTENS